MTEVAQVRRVPTMTPPTHKTAEQELAEHLAEAEGAELARAGWACDSEEKAVWVARRLAKIARDIAERERVAEIEIAKVQAWLDDANAALRNDQAFFEGALVFYHATVLREDETKKTVKLPGVTSSARKAPDTWEFDEPVFIAWAKRHAPDLVKIEESVKKAEAKKAIDVLKDGTVTLGVIPVEGVTVTRGVVGTPTVKLT